MLFMYIYVSIYHILLHKRVVQAIHSILSEWHNMLTCQKGHITIGRHNINWGVHLLKHG